MQFNEIQIESFSVVQWDPMRSNGGPLWSNEMQGNQIQGCWFDLRTSGSSEESKGTPLERCFDCQFINCLQRAGAHRLNLLPPKRWVSLVWVSRGWVSFVWVNFIWMSPFWGASRLSVSRSSVAWKTMWTSNRNNCNDWRRSFRGSAFWREDSFGTLLGLFWDSQIERTAKFKSRAIESSDFNVSIFHSKVINQYPEIPRLSSPNFVFKTIGGSSLQSASCRAQRTWRMQHSQELQLAASWTY